MRTTFPARRAAALVGAATISLSTALLCSTGVASATTTPDIDLSNAAATTVPVPSTACAVAWDLVGGSGGDSAAGVGGYGDELKYTTYVVPGSSLRVEPGQAGESAAQGGAGGTSGGATSGGAGGSGAGGGGGASSVTMLVTGGAVPLIVAAGGGGAGSQGDGGDADSDGGNYTDTTGVTFGGGQGASNAVGQGGQWDAGAPGADGAPGSGAVGGSGPAGAGGGGGGDLGGGSGASDGTDGGGGGGGASWVTDSTADSNSNSWDNAPARGNGSVLGTFVPCLPAGQPQSGEGGPVRVTAGDSSITVEFTPSSSDSGDPSRAKATGWEISIDGGNTWGSPIPDGGPTVDQPFTGLTNGHAYSVEVRSVSAAGYGTPTNPVSATPHHLVGAPTGFHATVGGASITLTWSPPAGEPGITGYDAGALPGEDPQSDGGLVLCPTLDASARTCTLSVLPGRKYTVSVAALTADGRGNGAHLVTEVVPAVQSAPAGAGSLGSPTGALSTVTAGQKITLTGSGYAPDSDVELYIYSSPVHLGTTTADSNGAFSAQVTMPADLEPGTHHLVAAGIDPSGTVRYLRTDVTLSNAGQLAWTGFEAGPFVGVGLLALAAGGTLVLAGRKRRTA